MRRPRNEDDINNNNDDSRKQYRKNQTPQPPQLPQPPQHQQFGVPQFNTQAQDYINKQRNNYMVTKNCGNEFDPLFPEKRLNLNSPIVFIFDNRNVKWCFNLITLWNKIKDSMYYDVLGLSRMYGFDHILCSFRTDQAEFNISIRMFDILKIKFFRYYHGVDLNPL